MYIELTQYISNFWLEPSHSPTLKSAILFIYFLSKDNILSNIPFEFFELKKSKQIAMFLQIVQKQIVAKI
jgi:hypothetical protein